MVNSFRCLIISELSRLKTTMKTYQSLNEATQDLYESNVTSVQPVTGGDINRAYRLEIAGISVLMKANSRQNTALQYGAFLLLEWSQGVQGKGFFEHFGRNLAHMHLADTTDYLDNGKYGYYKDNYIGSSKQINRPSDSWVQFFRDSRLAPQFRKASSYFDSSDQKRIRYLLDHLDKYLPEPEHASVLHGDLWCGNYIIGNDGEAWLIDPAVYLGHSEADLAMTELFGGFPREFYSAYDEVNPIDREYVQRRGLYNLYHILNHLNLFGGSYLWEVKRVLRQFGA